jgi:outer membrane immunogenic protein
MNSVKIAASVILLSSASALAADLASIKSAPVAVQAPMWTGFYAGLNAGGTWGNNGSINFITMPNYILPITMSGMTAPNANYAITDALAGYGNIPMGNSLSFIGGGQIGYNWKFLDSGLFGLETDFQGTTGPSGGNSTKNSLLSVPNNNNDAFASGTLFGGSRLDYLGTVRGRIGYLFSPSLLFYGTAGFAYGGITLNTFVDTDIISSLTSVRKDVQTYSNAFSGITVGWTTGGGVEWMLAQNWSLKAEYLYYDVGSVKVNADTMARLYYPTPSQGQILFVNETYALAHFNGNIVRAGVNYHFNFANVAPVVAKF